MYTPRLKADGRKDQGSGTIRNTISGIKHALCGKSAWMAVAGASSQWRGHAHWGLLTCSIRDRALNHRLDLDLPHHSGSGDAR